MTDLATVRTERLVLTQISERDFEVFRQLHSDPVVMATLGGVRTPERTRQDVEALSRHWEEHGYGAWVAREAESGLFVGTGGLRHVLLDGVPEIEIGYKVVPDLWGRGLATELARTSAHIAFGTLGLRELVCFTLPTNTPSRQVMEKIGFRYERDFTHEGYLHVLYRQTAAMWRAAVGSSGKS